MIHRVTVTASWFVADPMRVRLALCIVLLGLAIIALIVPGLRLLADGVPGTGHP